MNFKRLMEKKEEELKVCRKANNIFPLPLLFLDVCYFVLCLDLYLDKVVDKFYFVVAYTTCDYSN